MERTLERETVLLLAKKYRICPEVTKWAAERRSFDVMWDECKKPEWILRALDQLGACNAGGLRLFAAYCARRGLEQISDARAILIVEIAEAVGNGASTVEELSKAHLIYQVLEKEVLVDNWSFVRAAAIDCINDSIRTDPMEAALGATRNGLRASECVVKEEEWQANMLRQIFGKDLLSILAKANSLVDMD